MECRCDSCNLDFTDFQHYLDHECTFYDEKLLAEVYNDTWMCANAFNSFKSLNEGRTEDILVNEEQNTCTLTDTPERAIREILNFLKHSENQSCKETPNEKPALLQVSNNAEYFRQVQRSTLERTPHFNLNQPSSSVARKIRKNNAQSSSNPPSALRGICERMKQEYKDYPWQTNVNIIPRTQSDARVEKSSLLKCSNVNLKETASEKKNHGILLNKETLSEKNLFGRSLNNKKEEIGYQVNDKQTNRSHSVEEGFQENSTPVKNSFDVTLNLPKNPLTLTGEKRHVCEICRKKFKYKWDLKRHYFFHSGELLYQCGVCGKGFSHKGHLNIHYCVHSVEFPYKCDVCGKRYSRKCNLNAHLVIHSDERPYVCEKCDKGFKRKGDLKKHRITHTNPCECKKCGKECKNKRVLKEHRCAYTKS
ncbi:zinc finger protein 235 [Trichonephila clavipes]|nr:zinc finger protein 235 [Trichonephila clavipes]